MKKILTFYLISFSLVLLVQLIQTKEAPKAHDIGTISGLIEQALDKNFRQVTVKRAYIRLITGVNLQLDYRLKKAIDRCFLWPLFTLNLLHWGLILNWVKNFIIHDKFLKFFKLGLCFISPIKVIWEIKKNFKNKFSSEIIFYLGFICLLPIFLYFKNLYSFVVVFIFFGTFYLGEFANKHDTLIMSILSAILISFIQFKGFSFFCFFLGMIFYFLFKKLHPFLLIIFTASLLIKMTFLELIFKWLIQSYITYVNYLQSDLINSTLFLFVCLLIYLVKKDWRILILYLIFHSEIVYSPAIYYSK